MPRFLRSLFGQVLLALAVGVAIGFLWPEFGVKLKPLGDGFIKLIKMIIPVLVFCVVVHGIAGAGDLKRVGRVGVKALVYFEVMTTVALVVGLVLAYVFGPGHGMNIDPSTLDAKALNTYADNVHKLQGGGIGSFLRNIVPTTSIDALARNDVLQVLFFAILFGTGLALVGGEKGEKINGMIDAVSTVLFRVMGLIVRIAPLGVLGAVAYTVGKYGVGSLKQLLSLVALFYVSLAIFVFGVLGGVMALAGLNILKFLAYLREELTIVLATASSDAVLPQIMRKLEALGVKKSVVGLVIPTGYSFNLDAFSIYLTLAVVFIAQATNTPLSFGDLLLVLGVSLITSKGAHGVPGSAIVILAATLNAVPRSISFSHAAITTVATQLPIRLPSARAIPTNQSTESTRTRPIAGIVGTAFSVAAKITIAEPGTPWAPFDVTSETASTSSRSPSESVVLVACAIKTVANVR